MDIDEIREARDELQENIADLAYKFRYLTGCDLDSVSINTDVIDGGMHGELVSITASASIRP